MKLLNDFFRIVERGELSCKVAMNADHEIYKAHFPGNPITPGVCLVQMATEIFGEIEGGHFELAEISRIKYRNVVKPADQPTFRFTPLDDEKVKVTVQDGEKTFTEMTLKYKKVDSPA